VEEHRQVERGDATPHRLPVGGVGDATAGAVGLQQLRQHPGDAREGDRERCGVVGAVGVQEHLGVAGGQPVAALLGGTAGVVAGEVAGDRLLLQPLAGVAEANAGVGGDLGLGRGPEVGQGLVEAELQAQVDAEGLQRMGGGIDQPLGQRLTRLEVGVGSHRVLPGGLDGFSQGSVVGLEDPSSEGPEGQVAKDRWEVAGAVAAVGLGADPACGGDLLDRGDVDPVRIVELPQELWDRGGKAGEPLAQAPYRVADRLAVGGYVGIGVGHNPWPTGTARKEALRPSMTVQVMTSGGQAARNRQLCWPTGTGGRGSTASRRTDERSPSAPMTRS
jgi:hypothetical protein